VINGYVMDNLCLGAFINNQFPTNGAPGWTPDRVHVRSSTPQHTRGCLTLFRCAVTGFNLVRNIGTESEPNYRYFAGIEAGASGRLMFDFLVNARLGVDLPPTPPTPPPTPPAAPPPSTCDPSDEAGYDCRAEPEDALAGYVVHWRLLSATSIKMLVTIPDPTGFVGIGFSADGGMVGSDAVIGWPGHVEMYHLAAQDATIVGNNLVAGALTDASAALVDGNLRVAFTRPYVLSHPGAVTVVPTRPTRMIWSVGPSNSIEYHGQTRGAYTLRLDPSVGPPSAPAPPPLPPPPPGRPSPPPPPSSPRTAAEISSEEGFSFMLRSITGVPKGFEIHWRPPAGLLSSSGRRLEADDDIKILIKLPTPAGFVGIGFSADGNMIGSDAVIGWPGHVEMYHLAAQDATIVGNNLVADALTNASATIVNGTMRLEFTRPYVLSHPGAVVLQGQQSMLWSLGPSNALGYHGTNRGKFTVNYAGGAIAPSPPTLPPPPPTPPTSPTSGCTPSDEVGFEAGCKYEPPGAPDGYVLHWVLETTLRRSLAEASVKMLVTIPDPGGYVGIGFSSSGAMIGSDAVIGWPGHVEMYHLAAQDATIVGNNLVAGALTDASAALVDGNLRVAFTRPLLLSHAGAVPIDPAADLILLWSVGPGNALASHGASKGAYAVRLDGGEAGAVALTDIQKFKRLHGILMTISWGFLLPAGAVIAKFFKHKDPLWFHLHRFFQVCGLALAITGWVVALTEFGPLGGEEAEDNVKAHGILGILVMSIGFMQPCNALIRPHKDGKYRFLWECLHKGSGWFAIALAVAVITLGIDILSVQETTAFPDAKTHFWIFYGIFFGLLALLAAAGFLTGGKNGTQKSTESKSLGSSSATSDTKDHLKGASCA